MTRKKTENHNTSRARGTDAPALGVTVTNEGQRLLLALKAKRAEVADACGVSGPLVSQWKSGSKRPTGAARRALADTYGIDPGAWDRAPGTTGASSLPAGSKAPPALPADGCKPTTLGEVVEQLELLRAMRSEDLVHSERLKLEDTIQKVSALKARLEREAELFEDRAVKAAPFWRRVRAKIAEALKPYPDAARAVAEALGGDDA